MIKDKLKGRAILITGSVIIGLLILSIGLFSIYLIEQTAENTHNIYNHTLVVSNAIRDIKANVNAMHLSIKDVAHAENSRQIEDAVTIITNYEIEVNEYFDIVYDRFLGDMKDVKEAHQAFKDWKVIRDEVISLTLMGERDAALQITKGKGLEHVKYMNYRTQSMIDFANSKAEAFYNKSFIDHRNTKRMMIILIGLALFIGLGAFYMLDKSRIKDKKLLVQTQSVNKVLKKTQMIAKLGSYDYNPNTGKSIWSDELYSLLGYISGTIEPKPEVFIKQVHPDDRERVWAILNNSINEKTDYQSEFRLIKNDKSEICVVAYGKNRYNKAGKIKSQVGYIQDISDRKQAEQALSNEKEMAQNYLDVAGVMFVVINNDEKVNLVNKTGCKILGYAEAEIIGKNWFDNFLPDGNRDDVRELFYDLLNGDINNVDITESPVFCRNGVEKTIQWRNQVIHNEQGQPIGVLASGEDITERKKLEAGLLSATLDGQEKERNRLASEIHDGLALLLSTAKLNLEALSTDMSHLSSEKRSYYSSSKNLLDEAMIEVRAIINNLSPPVLDSMGLSAALNALCEKLNTSANKEIHFYENGNSSHSITKSNEVNLYRTAQEMLNNALKHGKADKISLQLIAHKNSIILIVEDNGIGFDKDGILMQKGNGLKSLISRTKSMDGRLNIDSTPGLGTVISVEIQTNKY